MGPKPVQSFRRGSDATSVMTAASERHRSLRILHVDSSRTWRGGQRQVLLLVTGLRRAGHAVVLATPSNGDLSERASIEDVPTRELNAASDLDILAATRLRRLIRETGPDVVHAHDARSHALALLALVGLSTPLVVTRRVTFRPRGSIKYGKRVARFIAISHAVREGLVSGGVDPARIAVVYSGVPAVIAPVPIDWRVRCGWPSESVICGLAGAMTREKGLSHIEQIVRALGDSTVARARLVLIGGLATPGPFRIGKLEGFRSGFIRDADNAIAGLDLIWHPATAEGLGTVLLEAMSLKVPPVAYATGGIPEIVENGVSGILIKTGDTQAFASAATRLIENSAARATLAAAGPARASQFSAQRMIDETAAVYHSVSSTGKDFSQGYQTVAAEPKFLS
jgi:glycosyltransferase involved in cell wall biosynthesis